MWRLVKIAAPIIIPALIMQGCAVSERIPERTVVVNMGPDNVLGNDYVSEAFTIERLLPLKIIGFLQYISPTLTLLIGVFVYNEAFTASHLLAFGWIWAALLLFIVSQLRSN